MVYIAPVAEKDILKSAILTESGFAKGIITKDRKYIAIRYKGPLDRGFVPPQSGGIKGTLRVL